MTGLDSGFQQEVEDSSQGADARSLIGSIGPFCIRLWSFIPRSPSMPFGIGARATRIKFFRSATDVLKSALVGNRMTEEALKIAAIGRTEKLQDVDTLDLAEDAVQLCLDILQKMAHKWQKAPRALRDALDELEQTLSATVVLLDDLTAPKKVRSFGLFTQRRHHSQDEISVLRKRLVHHESVIKALIIPEPPLSARTASTSSSLVIVRGNSAGSNRSFRSTSTSSFQHVPPPPPAIFFGRSSQVQAIIERITTATSEQPSHIAILGTGGVGKSSLALTVIHDVRIKTRFLKNRLFIRCDTARTADDMLAAVAKELGLEGAKAMDQVPKVLTGMTPGVLLVLDNFETPWEPEESRREVEQTLQRLSTIKTLSIIITMRGQQRPRGTLWTEPLLPPLLPFDLDSARKVFGAIAPDLQNDPQIDDLLKAVDCLPLVVTLLATISESEPSLASVLTRLGTEKTKFIRDGSSSDRLGSLDASIEVSIQSNRMKAEPGALHLLSLLALLPNGISNDDLQGATLGLQPSALAAAAVLRRTALAYDDQANARLRVLSPIRIYVATQYPPSTESLQALRKHHAEIARKGKEVGNMSGIAVLPSLRSEAENMQATIEHALLEQKQHLSWESVQWAIEAATNLTDFLWYSGLGSMRSLEIAASVSHELQQPLREADCLSSIGFVASGRAENTLAEDSYNSALAKYREHEHTSGVAECLRGLGFVAIHIADYPTAERCFEEGLDLFKRINGKWGMAQCLNGLAIAAYESARPTEAKEKYADSLQLFKEVQNITGEADCIRGLGFTSFTVGQTTDLEDAIRYFKEALELFQKVGKVTGEADCLRGLGMVEVAKRHFTAAEPFFQEAYELYALAGNSWKRAECLKGLGDVAAGIGKAEEARILYQDAMELFVRVGNTKGQAQTLAALQQLDV